MKIADLLEKFLDLIEENSDLKPEEFIKDYPEFTEEFLNRIKKISNLNSAFDQFKPNEQETDKINVPPPKGFQLKKILGKGGMGIVFLAYQESLNRDVAIKILNTRAFEDQDFIERLLREGKSLGQLDHNSIVKVFDVIHENNLVYLILEYVPGLSLAQIIQRLKEEGKQYSSLLLKSYLNETSNSNNEWIYNETSYERTIISMFNTIADGLAHAHEKNIIHRDIKPSNIIIKPNGEPKLIDFGLSSFDDDLKLTGSDQLIGSPLYMSREQINGNVITPQTDIYGLGVSLYEALSFESPYLEKSRDALFKVINAGEYIELKERRSELGSEYNLLTNFLISNKGYKNISEFNVDADIFLNGSNNEYQAKKITRINYTKYFSAVAALFFILTFSFLCYQFIEDKKNTDIRKTELAWVNDTKTKATRIYEKIDYNIGLRYSDSLDFKYIYDSIEKQINKYKEIYLDKVRLNLMNLESLLNSNIFENLDEKKNTLNAYVKEYDTKNNLEFEWLKAYKEVDKFKKSKQLKEYLKALSTLNQIDASNDYAKIYREIYESYCYYYLTFSKFYYNNSSYFSSNEMMNNLILLNPQDKIYTEHILSYNQRIDENLKYVELLKKDKLEDKDIFLAAKALMYGNKVFTSPEKSINLLTPLIGKFNGEVCNFIAKGFYNKTHSLLSNKIIDLCLTGIKFKQEYCYLLLSDIYTNGQFGTRRNNIKAKELLFEGYNAGSFMCLYYYTIKFIDYKNPEYKENLLKCFENNVFYATYNLGLLHDKVDINKSLEYYRKGISEGYSYNSSQLVSLNYDKYYKLISNKEMFKYAMLCFINNSKQGASTLADMWIKGIHVPKNQTRAKDILLKSAENGEYYSYNLLGNYYLNSLLNSNNPISKAYDMYRIGSNKGIYQATLNLAYLVKDNKYKRYNGKTYTDYLLLASKQGSKEATFDVGLMYELGTHGNKIDLNKALLFYEKSLKLGYAYAYRNIPLLCLKLKKSPYSKEELAEMMQKAIHFNIPNSKHYYNLNFQ